MMKAKEDNSLAACLKLLGCGIDTLVLNVYYNDEHGKPVKKELDEELASQLDEWQARAKEAEEAIASPWSFREARLFIAPHGAGKGQWRWLLTCPLLNVCISRGRLNGIIAQVRLSSEYLWSEDYPEAALVHVHAFLGDLFGPNIFLQVSEVHLCADLTGWDVSRMAGEESFVRRPAASVGSRPEESTEQVVGADFGMLRGRRLATLEFGMHRSPLSCSIYNKTLEIRQKSHKTWFYDLWKRHGWDGESEVWRVEFRFKREFLHEVKQEGVFHGIEDAYNLFEKLPLLWAYAVGHVQGGDDGLPDGWLRAALPGNDSNRSRWETHPAWMVIQGAFSEDSSAELGDVVRERKREVNVQRGLEATIGYVMTLAAWLGGEYAETETDISLLLHWLYEAGSAYLEARKRDFYQEVCRKRVLYGLPLGEETRVS
jgi:hypothetical protein